MLQIDHAEVFVPDRNAAAEWYERTLGMRIVPEYRVWADDPRGPLMISADGGNTKIALFEGPSRLTESIRGWRLVAFRVDATGFVVTLERLCELQVVDDKQQTITFASVVDHQLAWSAYFCDPYGNKLELTTYDYQSTRELLATRK